MVRMAKVGHTKVLKGQSCSTPPLDTTVPELPGAFCAFGRPRLGIEVRQKIARRTANGETPYAIAKALRIDRHTTAKYGGLQHM
jgi:hypothetical protein